MLPGMDGTGQLFQPFINALPSNINYSVISYPENVSLSYEELEEYVLERLPVTENYVLLAESFSGPIGYFIAKRNLKNMKGVFFVATFLESPKKLLIALSKLLPLSLLLKLPIPKQLIKTIFFSKEINEDTIILFKEIIKRIPTETLTFRINEVSKLSLKLEKIHIKSYYIQALNDKLVSSNNLTSFLKISDTLKIKKINGPHFILQTKPEECAEFITREIRLITRHSS